MIHHDKITAKRVPDDDKGGTGEFDIIENNRGEFSVYNGGTGISTDCGSLEEAVKIAQRAADQFDVAALEDLKAKWRESPTWNIEDTEGFEDCRQELYIYRLETELAVCSGEIQRMISAIRPFATLLNDLRG